MKIMKKIVLIVSLLCFAFSYSQEVTVFNYAREVVCAKIQKDSVAYKLKHFPDGVYYLMNVEPTELPDGRIEYKECKYIKETNIKLQRG
jgi:hypothetical protein